MNEPRRSDSGIPTFFWWIIVGSVLSLGGGITLFIMNQAGSLGANAGAGPGLRSQTYVVQQRVDIWKNESWHPGQVLSVDGSDYRVRYDETIFGEETVDVTRLQEHPE